MRASRPPRGLLAFLLALILAGGAAGSAAAQAGGEERAPLFTADDLLFAGGFVLGTAAMAPIDLWAARTIQDSVPQANRVLGVGAEGLRFLGFPGSVLVAGGMYAAGRIAGRDRLADAGLHTAGAIVVGQGLNGAIKLLAGRARPWVDVDNPFNFGLGRGLEGDRYQSFPSGHTAAAFATAAALAHEIGGDDREARLLAGGALYSAAALVGVSRMYHNRHWASDVVMGAAIGSFAGWKTVRWAHGHPDNPVDRWLLSVSMAGDLRGPVRVLLLPAPVR